MIRMSSNTNCGLAKNQIKLGIGQGDHQCHGKGEAGGKGEAVAVDPGDVCPGKNTKVR